MDGRTHGRTDGRTHGQRENSIPPTNKVCGGYNKHIISDFVCIHSLSTLGCTWGFSVIECRGVSSCLPGDSCELPTSWLDNKLLPAEKNVKRLKGPPTVSYSICPNFESLWLQLHLIDNSLHFWNLIQSRSWIFWCTFIIWRYCYSFIHLFLGISLTSALIFFRLFILLVVLKIFLIETPISLNLYLLMLSADNFCEQFGPRSGPTKCRA